MRSSVSTVIKAGRQAWNLSRNRVLFIAPLQGAVDNSLIHFYRHLIPTGPVSVHMQNFQVVSDVWFLRDLGELLKAGPGGSKGEKGTIARKKFVVAR